MFKRIISLVVLMSFFMCSVMPNGVCAQALILPAPGTMVDTSEAFTPVILKGLQVKPENPMLFDFIVDTGNSGLKAGEDDLAIRAESEKLIKYFLASLTLPEKDQWVNLSPYEKDRMMTEELEKTELGRDMLAQDYLLKQVTASLIYPEQELGKQFWQKVYEQAQERFGSAEIPVDTFNKVWVVADKADVYVHDNMAFVVGSHLKVMLESDYLAQSRHPEARGAEGSPVQTGSEQNNAGGPSLPSGAQDDGSFSSSQDLAKQVVREIVLPALEAEVNTGKNFANLRQIFHSMILATWYKKNLKEALLNQVYSDKAKTNGVELAAAASNLDPQAIYTKYVEAYKKGVFNFIKEDTDSATGETVAHKYFSGGMAPNLGITDGVLKVLDNTASDEVQDFAMDSAVRVSAKLQAPNAAMSAVMTWNDINGDIERWLPLTKQVMVSDIDAILDMYRDYDYRYVKDSVKLSPAVVFIQTLVLAKMAIEKAKAAGISSRDVLVARDARKIEPELVDAEIAALRYAGLNVYFAGKNPNCVTSYSWGLQSHEWLMTIFDTASHVSQPNGVMDEEEFSKLGADGSTILRTLLDQGLYKQVSSGKVQIQQTMQETERLLGVLYSGLPEEKVKAIMSILSPDVIVRGRKVTQLRKPGGNLLSLTKKEIKQDSLRMVRGFLGDKGKIDEMGAVKEGDLFQIDIEKDAIRFNTAVGLEAANNGSLYQLGVNIKQAADSKAAVEGVLARLGGNKPLKDLKIVVEGSNTPSGPLATKVFENLGAEVVGLNQEVKEISGLHQADPAIEKNREGLKRKIIETHAHFGIAFDLDGDRALILVPEWYKDGSIKTFHALAPDNLLGVLLPYLLNDWGYRASGKEQALIADVLGTYAVTMAALHNGVVMKRTDAGYVFLKAMKEVLEPLGFVVPVYGELSGHTWLHVSGEVENPVAVAVLFATIVSREMKKDDPNPVYHVYDERTPDKFTQSPRFQPFYHPKLLKWLAWHNDKEWNYVPGVNPPQAIIELGKHETVVRLTRAFPLGHEFKTSNGVYKVSYLDAYNDADDGLYRYVDIMFEKDGKFIGRVVVRASSNDPTFVMSYEAPISGISAEEAARNRVVAAGLVMKFMVNEGLAIFTRRQMREAMTWLGEGAREIEFNKYNLSFPAADYEEFTVQEAANARFSDAAMAAPERIDGLEILSTPEGKKAQFVKTQEAFLIKEMLTDINSLHYGIVQALSALKAGWSKADTTIHVPLFGYHGGRDTMEEKSPHRKIITQLIDLLFPNRPFVPVSGKPFRLLWLTGVFSLLTESNGVYSSSDFKQALTALKDSTEGVIAYLEANIDRAMETMPGGIDLNSQNMQMNAQGQKIDMQFDPAMIEQFKSGDFSGLTPVILNITPITNIRPLLGLAPEAVGGASAEATGISKAVRRESEV